MINNKKKLLEEWEQYCQYLQSLNEEETLTENPKEKESRVKTLLDDYEAFVEYYFQSITRGTKCADFQIKAAKKIKKTNPLKAVFEWARGHAKSSHFSLMIPLWLKANQQTKTIVLVGKSEDDAIRLIAKIQAQLQNNAKYIRDFGVQVNQGNWEQGEFTTTDGVKFIALGRGQSPRGMSSNDSFRPDYIVIDDLDDDELVLNPKRVRKMTEWIKSALFGALDMGRGRFIMVGNRIHKESVLAKIAKSKNVYHTKVNALNENGQPSWHQKYTLEEILQAIEFMGYRMSQKEYFNNPIVEGTVFKAEHIIYDKIPNLKNFDALVCYCDPSFKSTTKNDYKAIVLLGKYKTKLFIISVFVRQCSVSAMVKYLYDTYEQIPEDIKPITSFYMEANFMQDILLDEFFEEGLARNYQLPIVGDKRKKPDKFQRIESISPLFERGLIDWNDKIKEKTDTEKAVEQLLSIEKGSTTADDFPDALEGAIFKMQSDRYNYDPESIRIGKRINKSAY
jgi:hypothetical protein